ncbi:MAG: hypothetical protein AB7F32_00300 [Victivallaceae bacterium]
MGEITLSICLNGRNDNYGFDFKRRLVQSMNFLAWSAGQAGVLERLEVVLTDWNSDVPLSSELKLSAAAAAIVRFVEVPPELARPLNYGKTPFHTARSLNVAFRRARGRYIGMMPADILLTRFALHSLFELLEHRQSAWFSPEDAMMGIPRRFLPNYGDDGAYFTTPESIERLLGAADFFLAPDAFSKGLASGFGLFILAAERLHRLRGCNEQIGGWGNSDIELGLRAAATGAPTVNLAALGVMSYDFDVTGAMVREKKQRMDKNEAMSALNAEDWGCGNCLFAESRAEVGEMNWEPRPLPADPESELLQRFRFLPLTYCSRISAYAAAAGVAALVRHPRSILIPELDDAAVAAAVALGAPYAELTLVTTDVSLPGLVAGALAAMHHPAAVRFLPAVPAGETFDLVVSPETIDLSGVSGFAGNCFSAVRFSARLEKLWNLLGRLPFCRWPGAYRMLKRNF